MNLWRMDCLFTLDSLHCNYPSAVLKRLIFFVREFKVILSNCLTFQVFIQFSSGLQARTFQKFSLSCRGSIFR
ncbi:hypothetical protein V5799_020511 [Amblyomma americanum]|uniref:Uncharacterized protein n=1 Tax=Amblyomma americanum TaxID=6943 RepID=A0AAQ4ETT4_AMBAM